MTITLSIDKKKIYDQVEGLTVMLVQKNPEGPKWNELWASPSDEEKLDMGWREAVSALELAIKKYLIASTGQYDLMKTCGNYSLQLNMGHRWQSKLQGLLGNKLQEYCITAVLGHWMSTFGGDAGEKYITQAASTLVEIVGIMAMQDLAFGEREAAADDAAKPDADASETVAERQADDGKLLEDAELWQSSARVEDTATGTGGHGWNETSEDRHGDTAKGDSGQLTMLTARKEDTTTAATNKTATGTAARIAESDRIDTCAQHRREKTDVRSADNDRIHPMRDKVGFSGVPPCVYEHHHNHHHKLNHHYHGKRKENRPGI